MYTYFTQEALAKPCVFGVDDAHWIDQYSWSFFLDLAKEDKAIVLLSMMPPVFSEDNSCPKAMEELMKLPGSKVLQLKPLKPEKMVELTCILLGVDGLPKAIEDIIREKTQGIPLFAEEIVESLLENNVLNFHSVVKTQKWNNGSTQGRGNLWQRKMSCTLNEDVSLSDIPIPESINEMILARVNHLPEATQFTIKCAAVIGTTFTKSMLKGIIPKHLESTLANSIRLLQAPGIIRCAVAEAYKMAINDGNEDNFLETQNLYCPCLEHIKHCTSGYSLRKSKNVFADVHNLGQCELLQFSHPIFRETIYGLWTEKQCIQLHEKAALFLESQAHKCKNCGGGEFITGGQTTEYMKKMRPGVPAGGGDSNVTNGKGKMSSGNIRAFMGLHRRKARDWRRKIAPSKDISTPSQAHRGQDPSIFIKQVQSQNSSIGSLNWVPAPKFSTLSSRNGIESLIGQHSRNQFQSNVWNNTPLTGSSIADIDLQHCQCEEVLAHVYPQLIIHWKAAGNMKKTVHYLIEAANAAIATNNDMEALALLDEAKQIMKQSKQKLVTEHEMAVFESSYGQVS